MAEKGTLCSLLFISRRTSSANIDISSFCIKGLKYFGKPLGSCKSLSKSVSYLARSCMIERKNGPCNPSKVLHWIREKVSCTLLTSTQHSLVFPKHFVKSLFFPAKTLATLLLLSPVSPLLIRVYDTRLRMTCGAFMASNLLQ